MSDQDFSQADSKYIKAVAQMMKDLRYGSITITIQDGKVVQIEKSEKLRWKN